jgi:hypothetical protein
MTRSTVVANRRLYTVSGLEPRARGQIFQAVVMAQLVDGLTGAPVEGGRVSTSFAGLRSRSAHSGFVGLAGDPSRALPELDTIATPYDVDVLFEADGYAARHEVASFVQQPGFPGAFTAEDFGVLAMRRAPSVLHVGTYELDATNRPVALAAAARVTGYWTSLEDLGSAAVTTPLLALTTGLSARRPSGATVDTPLLTVPAEPPRKLATAVPAGTRRIAVSNTGTLVAGDLIGLDLADPDRAERIEVVAVHGAADLMSPAELELRFPVSAPHRDGTPAERIVAPGAGPPPVLLTAEALEGDQTLAVSTLAGLAAGQVVRVSGGAAAAEYRTTDLYEVTTNGDGFGHFPPMTGLAAVVVAATSGALAADSRVTVTQPTPAVDLTLT